MRIEHPSAASVKAIEDLIKRSSFGVPAVQDLREQVSSDDVEDVLGRITQRLAGEEQVEAEVGQVRQSEHELAWYERAKCLGADPDLFFPARASSPTEAQLQSAKDICALCPVREECLQYALSNDEQFGIWGGLSEEERRALRRNQKGLPA
jgi:WhiB family redox-sensing transcriptional regulator